MLNLILISGMLFSFAAGLVFVLQLESAFWGRGGFWSSRRDSCLEWDHAQLYQQMDHDAFFIQS